MPRFAKDSFTKSLAIGGIVGVVASVVGLIEGGGMVHAIKVAFATTLVGTLLLWAIDTDAPTDDELPRQHRQMRDGIGDVLRFFRHFR